MTKIIKKEKQPRYTIALSFEDKSEYEFAMEAWQNYPKLQRFVEGFESKMRDWRKYGHVPDVFDKQEYENVIVSLPYDLENWYYEIKKEWIE